ncbi:Uncharacterized protein dnl_04200 [Desulfonema limicola]|uniref:Uncharacterized protein n=1 Tax=Desulfonema limicola TaxID=45656 RepID=A0A975B3P8_9BACT|nr:hypothetical protein [Desulfonema limicola]QTA78203.1 Uncharacterized protein dnl_04200 [Desulfonema limicola]
MKQKYQLSKDNETNQLILKEFAELDKDILSLLCEQVYDSSLVEAAAGENRETLIALLRTQNMYPPSLYMEKIADSVIELYGPGDISSAEIFFDDSDFLVSQQEEIDALAGLDDDSDDLDDLLDDADDLDDALVDDDDISNIGSNSSIKIADDESLDIEDDV